MTGVFGFLIYVYDVPIYKLSLIGLGVFVLTIICIALYYGYKISDGETNAKKILKSPQAMSKIRVLWSELMDGSVISLYTGRLNKIGLDDGKVYYGGTFDVDSGIHQGTQVVLIYCVDDDDLVRIEPSPSPKMLENPFIDYEPRQFSKYTMLQMREKMRRGGKSAMVNVDMGVAKKDEETKEHEDFDKATKK